jgi:hypothetical protein
LFHSQVKSCASLCDFARRWIVFLNQCKAYNNPTPSLLDKQKIFVNTITPIKMLLSFIVGAAAFLTTVSSSPVPSENIQITQYAAQNWTVVGGAMDITQTAVKNLTKIVKTFDGEALNAVPILDASSALYATLVNSTSKIEATDAIGLIDTLVLLLKVYTLNSAVADVVDSLKAKKPLFDKAFVTIVVADELEKQSVAAQNLVTAIVAKLPAYIPGFLGTFFASGILQKLQTAADAFKQKV